MIRRTYRAAAEACAELVWRVPILERPFIGVGAHAWGLPGVGRFYRSAAHRLAERMRSGGTPYRPVTIRSQRLTLDVTEFTAGPLYFGGSVYEPETTDFFVAHLKPGDVFVDIGANHGYFTMLAAAIVGPRGRVEAFEPNPRVFAQLEAHARLNRFDATVRLHACALADRAEAGARLYVSQVESNSGLSSLTPNPALLDAGGLSEEGTVPVVVDTFDAWFATSGLSRIDLIKIDVEGAESRVLAGMSAALGTGRIAALVIETTPGGPADRLLVEAGYRPRPLDTAGVLTNVLYTWTGPSAETARAAGF